MTTPLPHPLVHLSVLAIWGVPALIGLFASATGSLAPVAPFAMGSLLALCAFCAILATKTQEDASHV